MIRAIALTALLWFTPDDASAEALKVRAGEHGGFSRIVIPVPQGMPLVKISGHELKVVLDAVESADLSQIESRRASRVLSARQAIEGGRLALVFEMSCECEPLLSAGADGEIVLDIYGAARPAPAGPLAGNAGPEQSEADEARERLMQAMVGAASAGVVRLRNEGEAPGTGPQRSASSAIPEFPGDSRPEMSECLREDDLADGALEADSQGTQAPEDLALSYLRRGFFAESFAIARGDETSGRMRFIAAVAGAFDRRPQSSSIVLDQFADCGPAHRLLVEAAHAAAAPGIMPNLAGDERDLLERLAPGLRFAVAEALAHAVHEQGDHASARELAQIARAALPAQASVRLDIIDAAQPGNILDDETRLRLSQASREPGAQQLRAIDSLGAVESPGDRIADLRLAARLSPSDAMRLEAANKAAELLDVGGDIMEAIAVYAQGRWTSEALATAAREAAAARLKESIGRDPVSATAAFMAYEDYLSTSVRASELRVSLARAVAGLGDNQLTNELLTNVSSSDRALIEREIDAGIRPMAATPPQFAAFSNERLALSPDDPEGAVRAARTLEREAAAMRQILMEGKTQ